ncbi:MAG: CIA30 family protein [Pseudomonadota bacterium]
MASSIAVIDDFSVTGASASNAGNWRYVADTVMGGVSRGKMTAQTIMGRPALRMTGAVSTDNNGGFIQIALNLGEEGQVVEASAFKGFEIDAIGNREEYNIHLRTTDLRRSWESYRASFALGPKWQTFTFAFADFDAYRALKPLDPAKLRSIGIVAIGREFEADVAVGGVRLYA